MDRRIEQGTALELTEDIRALLRRVAPTVALSEGETEAALATVESASALLLETRTRVSEGSHRTVSAKT